MNISVVIPTYDRSELLLNVIQHIIRSDVDGFKSVESITIDAFVTGSSLSHIDLLKMDVEEGELQVLQGASETLGNGLVDIIHFEFTEANTVSGVFMKDFYPLLPKFSFHRMVRDGLVPLGSYYTPIAEIFAYQNVVSVRNGVKTWV